MGRTQLDKRTLSEKEYWAFKQMVGALNTIVNNQDVLEGRCKLVKNGLRDIRMVRSVLMKLYENVWKQTIPVDQQERIRLEFQNTKTYIDVSRPQDNGHRPEYCFMPTRNLENILNRVMEQECQWCMKCGKEVSRCKLKQDIEATYEWEIQKKMPDGTCPFATLIRMDENEVV